MKCILLLFISHVPIQSYNLSKFKLKKTEQEILLAAAKAHTGYLLNQKKVEINISNDPPYIYNGWHIHVG